jgi:hypothetical protein
MSLLSQAIEAPDRKVIRTFDNLAEPVLARYNASFAPWFMRRNQTGLAVRWCGHLAWAVAVSSDARCGP